MSDTPLGQMFTDCELAVQLENFLQEEATRLTISQQCEKRDLQFLMLNSIQAAAILSWINGLGFHVQLRESDTPDEWLKSLGHEMAHTFESPENLNSFELILPTGIKSYQDLEALCEEFANRWVRLETVQACAAEICAELQATRSVKFVPAPSAQSLRSYPFWLQEPS